MQAIHIWGDHCYEWSMLFQVNRKKIIKEYLTFYNNFTVKP